ncbi:MAG: homoserine O-succinyltransferase [Alphaproteobacteria bacterium]|nr:homoserine O-succinyltransferase [Alphaproteobacteria bacterium]
MPVILDPDLPAYTQLKDEGVAVLTPAEAPAERVRVAILNVMPKKVETETQLARGLAASGMAVEPVFLKTHSHESKNTAKEHLDRFYRFHDTVKDETFEGLIITGAPVEHLPFEEVTYWREFLSILDWSVDHVGACLFICWAAQGALFHWHGVPKRDLDGKMFGVFAHRTERPDSPLAQGLAETVEIPASRHTEVAASDLDGVPEVEIVLHSAEGGVCLMEDRAAKRFYMMNHLEYDADTLLAEYQRDVDAGAPIDPPKHYFPGDDPTRKPTRRWNRDADVFYRNWVDVAANAKPKLKTSKSEAKDTAA